jgi:heme-degrading monooxygenase HmoA
MYASVLLLKYENLNWDELEKRAQEQSDRLKSMKGFVCAVVYSDREKSEYGMTTVWDTEEDYEAFRDAEAPETREAITKYGVRNQYNVNAYITAN